MSNRSEANRKYYLNGGKQKILESNRKRREEIRNYLNEVKDVPCCDCGERHPPYVMQFDHVDPSTKEFGLANAARDQLSWEKIKEEVAKCEIVCANCHMKRTHGNASVLNR